MRTYSGHSTARASNELYRSMLAKGQTGLSVAFDLPTQTGYDADHPMARGEVGKVGVPVTHLGHMAQLMDGIPPDAMNTSMTINATAPWLLSLYIANAQNAGVASEALRGTTQNDIVKEYLSRGTYIFGPDASRRLTTDVVAYCSQHVPQWNPINVCSYHLQEAGATPTQEIAYALATAIDVLDAVRDSGKVPPGPVRRHRGQHLVLRERGHPLHRRGLQGAGLHPDVGPDLCRSLRGGRPQDATVPLRRAGELARAHRGTAGEQRGPHHARNPRRHAVAASPDPLAAAACLE